MFVGSWDSYFYALDAADGTLGWKFKTGEDPKVHNQQGIQSSAAVAGGLVYFGCRDSKFYALDEATGEKKWSFDNKGSWVITSPAVKDGKVYFATADTGKFHAFDAKTGAPVFMIDFKGWPMFSSPALAGGQAFIGSHSGKLFAIDIAQQKISGTFATEASAGAAPYTNADGTVNYGLIFTPQNGPGFSPEFFYDPIVVGVQKTMSFGAFLSSPMIEDGVLYVGSSDGSLYALE